MLIQKIEAKRNKARKEKNEIDSKCLSFFLGEVRKIGKNDGNRETTDTEIVKEAKKLRSTNLETLAIVSIAPEMREQLEREVEIYEEFIPKQLNEEELIDIIKGIIEEEGVSSMKQMGVVMKRLKENYEGLFDGRVASGFVKSILK